MSVSNMSDFQRRREQLKREKNEALITSTSAQTTGGGPSDPDIERRLSRLEDDFKEVKSDLKTLLVDAALIKGKLDGIDGRFKHIPTSLQLIMFALAVLAISGVTRYLEARWSPPPATTQQATPSTAPQAR